MWRYYLYRDMTLNGSYCAHVRAFYAARFGVVRDRNGILTIRKG